MNFVHEGPVFLFVWQHDLKSRRCYLASHFRIFTSLVNLQLAVTSNDSCAASTAVYRTFLVVVHVTLLAVIYSATDWYFITLCLSRQDIS